MQMPRRMSAMVGAVALAAGMGLVVLGGGPAGAAISPTTTADDGSPGSLREILENLPVANETVVLQAGATYDLTDDADGEIDISDAVTIEGNGATIRQTDGDDNVLETGTNLTLRNVTITGGRARFGDGGGIQQNDIDSITRIESSSIVGNATLDQSGDGGGLASVGAVIVIASTFADNCSADDGGAMDVDDDVLIVNSTITGNTEDDQGAIEVDSPDEETNNLTLVYSDVVGNTLQDQVDCADLLGTAANAADETDDEAAEAEAAADEVEPADTEEPSNISVDDGDLIAFGSVVARPIDLNGDPAFNCGFIDGGAGSSSGYNFSDDATCQFTNAGAGDRENAGDPGLGVLAANGGPTQTLLPSVTSPLVNFIPLAACSGGDGLAGFAVTTDQRGISRPQATGCEIGSVELEVLVVEPTFTG